MMFLKDSHNDEDVGRWIVNCIIRSLFQKEKSSTLCVFTYMCHTHTLRSEIK